MVTKTVHQSTLVTVRHITSSRHQSTNAAQRKQTLSKNSSGSGGSDIRGRGRTAGLGRFRGGRGRRSACAGWTGVGVSRRRLWLGSCSRRRGHRIRFRLLTAVIPGSVHDALGLGASEVVEEAGAEIQVLGATAHTLHSSSMAETQSQVKDRPCQRPGREPSFR